MPRSCRADQPDIPSVDGPQQHAAYQGGQNHRDHEPPEGVAHGELGAIRHAHGCQKPEENKHQFFAFLTRSSTTDGSARVDVSPKLWISPSAILRRMRRMILPE